MSKNDLTYQDLLQIVELIRSSLQFSEFHLKLGDIEVDLKRDRVLTRSDPEVSQSGQHAVTTERKDVSRLVAEEVPKPHQRHGYPGGGEFVTELERPPALDKASTTNAMPPDIPEGSILIKSPMVGTFYRSPEPGAQPFVQVGQRVSSETVICIIEVMKLMNSIPAPHSGIITHILVEDSQPVEFGQVLMVIDPNDAA